MTTQKIFPSQYSLLAKGLLLIIITMVTTACLTNDTIIKKSDIVQIVLVGEEDAKTVDFGETEIGNEIVVTKTFKLTNLSKLDVNIAFEISETQGYNLVRVSGSPGKQCETQNPMFVKGNEVCYFGIEFRPTIRITDQDRGSINILVNIDGKEYKYDNLFVLQGIAKNSEAITFINNINFGSTAKHGSKLNSTTLQNATDQSIFYNIVIPDNISIEKNSTCRQSGFLNKQLSCDIVFRYSATDSDGDISEIITVEQDQGNNNITASMTVKSLVIDSIVEPTPRYDASAIISGSNISNGKLELIGGRNFDNTSNDIWMFNIKEKKWTLKSKSPFGHMNDTTVTLYGNRATVVNNKTLLLPNPITVEDLFDNRTFTLGGNYIVEDMPTNTSNAKNNYKLAVSNGKTYAYGGIVQVQTIEYELTDNLSLILNNGSFDNITTVNNPDRHLAAFTSSDNKLYLFGGSTKDNMTTIMSKNLFEYHIDNKTWVEVNNISLESDDIPISNSAEMVYLNNGDKALYVFGGNFENDVSEKNKSSLYKFLLNTKTWSKITTSVMPSSRTKHNLVPFMNRYIYLFGGLNSDNQSTNDLWVFDSTTSEWEKINFPLIDQNITDHAVTTSEDGRYIYIYGGQTADGVASTKFMVYDTELNYFKELAPIGTGTEFHRFGHQLVYAKDGNAILLLGGSETLVGAPVDKHYQYDIKENKWTLITPTGGNTADLKIADHTAVNKDGTIYIIGGRSSDLATGTALNKVVTITFADNETATQPVVTNINKSMTTARYKHSATVLGDEIYVAGGRTNSSSTTNSVEKFNLTTQTWSNGISVNTTEFSNGFRDSSLVADSTTLYLIGGINNLDYKINKVYKLDIPNMTWNEVTIGDTPSNGIQGSAKFEAGKTYFVKANGAFINFGGNVLSIIYP